MVLKKITLSILTIVSTQVYATAQLPDLGIKERSVYSIPEDLMLFDNAVIPANKTTTDKQSSEGSQTQEAKKNVSSSLDTPPLPTDVVVNEIKTSPKLAQSTVSEPNLKDVIAYQAPTIRVYGRDVQKDLDARLATKDLPYLEVKAPDSEKSESSSSQGFIDKVFSLSDFTHVKVSCVDIPLDLIPTVSSHTVSKAVNKDPTTAEFLHELTLELREITKLPVAGVKVKSATLDKVELEVYAGKLNEIKIENGSSQFSDEQILDYFDIQKGDVITDNNTQKPLLLMQEHGLDAVGEFTATNTVGVVDFVVKVKDGKSFHYGIGVSSAVPSSLGLVKFSANYENKSLFTIDKLIVNASITDEAQASTDIAYSFKVSDSGGFLGFKPFYTTYSTSRYKVQNDEMRVK